MWVKKCFFLSIICTNPHYKGCTLSAVVCNTNGFSSNKSNCYQAWAERYFPHDLQYCLAGNKDGPSLSLTPAPPPTCWRVFRPGRAGQTCTSTQQPTSTWKPHCVPCVGRSFGHWNSRDCQRLSTGTAKQVVSWLQPAMIYFHAHIHIAGMPSRCI